MKQGYVHTVVDLWGNQRGVSNVFLTYFDFFRVSTNLGVESHQRGVKPSQLPLTIRALCTYNEEKSGKFY